MTVGSWLERCLAVAMRGQIRDAIELAYQTGLHDGFLACLWFAVITGVAGTMLGAWLRGLRS
jgi:hypothetical protein